MPKTPEMPSRQSDRPHYVLRCTHCGANYPADPFRLHCDKEHRPALLRAEYSAKTLQVRLQQPGIFRYSAWLPVGRSLNLMGKPMVYESKGLAQHLGLSNLYVSFNGYWPERDAQLTTGSFKELEAATVLARIPEGHDRTLVITSAGNTGRAFATLCSQLQIPLLLIIPEKNLNAIWSPQPFNPNVRLIAIDGDYSDAIALGQQISQMDAFFPEGGAANVARRDGMGLTVIDAVATLGRIPDHYFQAVGSGTGGIAAWEATQRLLRDGRFGSRRMRLHLAQNSPFTPMVQAWNAKSRSLLPSSEALDKAQIQQVTATVLTNRNPAYSLCGGLYEALRDTRGSMYAVMNDEAARARHLFEMLEGIDICPASSMATAALVRAVEAGQVRKQDSILLNITSGGSKRMQHEHPSHLLEPTWRVPAGHSLPDDLMEALQNSSALTARIP